MMIKGTACGKGLNVKGKSAKTGEISGFVPLLQISEEEHKHRCASRRASRTRICIGITPSTHREMGGSVGTSLA